MMRAPVYRPAAANTQQILAAIPHELRKDPWVVYHGTSGASAEKIDRDGFDPKAHFNVEAVVSKIAQFYESIGCFRARSGGYAVLKSFAEFDYNTGREGVTFFALSPDQASLYATSEFYGGEKWRAVRIALQDLEARLSVNEPSSNEVSKQDFDAINAFLKESEVNECLRKQPDSRFGVLYAVRMEPATVHMLDYNGHMGLMATRPIPPGHICAKLIVPVSCRWAPLFTTSDDILRLSPETNPLFRAMLHFRKTAESS